MPARSFTGATLAFIALAPLACSAINPRYREHDDQSHARANVPSGLLAPGRWTAEMAGTPPAHARLSVGGVVEFEVEVTPVRDSAQLVFLVPRYVPAPGPDVDEPSPQADVLRPRWIVRSNATSRQVVRMLPTDVWIDDGVMQLSLPNAMGWSHVRCRLVRNTTSSIWEGPCLASDGLTAVRLMLALPQAAPKSDG
jgi:hypothetical protein